MKYQHSEAWNRAFDKAQQTMPAVVETRRDPVRNGYGIMEFDVASSRPDGPSYKVRFTLKGSDVHTMCSCTAGRHDKPCYHVARVFVEFSTREEARHAA